jgi:hypothetical protein
VADVGAMKDAIVVPTHVSGIAFLENLLGSLQGLRRYPIVIVVNGFRERQLPTFLAVKQRFADLPITLLTLKTNSFEFGGLLAAYRYTSFDNLFLLPHSCEVVSPALFDLVFERHRERSVALALAESRWGSGMWHSQIGKYRRQILDRIDLEEYLPRNMLEAIKTEVFFTRRYHSLDGGTVVLFPDWTDSNVFEEKFGRRRMKIANEYVIKWKSHWTVKMVADELGPWRYVLYTLKDRYRRGRTPGRA